MCFWLQKVSHMSCYLQQYILYFQIWQTHQVAAAAAAATAAAATAVTAAAVKMTWHIVVS